MTVYFQNPDKYLTKKEPPALVIEAPENINPLEAIVANPRFALSFGYSGTVTSTASGTTTQTMYLMPLFPDTAFMEQVENLQGLVPKYEIQEKARQNMKHQKDHINQNTAIVWLVPGNRIKAEV